MTPTLRNFNLLAFLFYLALGGLWLYMAMIYPSLPDVIATHFDGSGKADGWGNKSEVVFICGFLSAIALGVNILGQYPQYHNQIVKRTPQNETKLNALSALLVKGIGIIVLYFGYVIIWSAAHDAQSTTIMVLVSIGLASLFCWIGYHLYASLKLRT